MLKKSLFGAVASPGAARAGERLRKGHLDAGRAALQPARVTKAVDGVLGAAGGLARRCLAAATL